MRYRYLGYSTSGGVVKGEVVANSEAEATLLVKERGYKLLELHSLTRPPALEELFSSFSRVSAEEIARFARHLATLLGTGSGLRRSLELMHKQTKNQALQRSLASMLQALDSGESFSAALSRHTRVFGSFFCRVVEVGEYTGRLDTSLRQIGELLERDSQARKKALRSLMYPMAVLGLALATTTLLFLVALPPLLAVFDRLGTKLPLATRLALGLTRQLRSNFPYMVLGLVLGVMLLRMALSVPAVRYGWDALRLRLPVLGGLLVAGELARASRSLSILLGAGVSLPAVLNLLAESSRNLVVRRVFADAAEGIMRGESLATAFERHRVMPAMFVQMVATGEETNSLSQTLGEAAEAYQQQTDENLSALIGLLEPVTTIGVALLIGFIAYSMFVPIYSGLGAMR